MAVLPENLVKEFVKITNDDKKEKKETFLYGTVHIADNHMDVILDGASTATPCTATVSVNDGDRVVVMLMKRQAVITANITSPSITTDTLLAGTIIAKDQYKIYALWYGRLVEINFAKVDTSTWIDPTDPEYDPAGEIDKNIIIGEEGPFTQVMIASDCLYAANRIETEGLITGVINDISDRNLKHDITDTDESDALGKINQIKHRKYIWNKNNKPESLGYIAQELGEIDPELESTDGRYCSINNLHLMALATKAIQELSAKVDSLERRVEELESKRN